MTEQELADLEARLTDGEPLVSERERTYIADIRLLLAEVRALQLRPGIVIHFTVSGFVGDYEQLALHVTNTLVTRLREKA